MNINTQKLKLAMLRKCMSRVQLGESSGISPISIDRIMKRGTAQIATIGKFAVALEVSPAWLADMEEL